MTNSDTGLVSPNVVLVRSISLPLSGEKWDATAVFLATVNSGHYRILAQAVCSE